MSLSLIGIILLAIAIGWLLGRWNRQKDSIYSTYGCTSKEYFEGINYILNDQTDEAIEVFTKALQVNEGTIETFLAVGEMFRRRGEIDRATYVHQQLLAKPNVTKEHHERIQLALARDYISAGLLDRAEQLLIFVVKNRSQSSISACKDLVKVYEQEKEWEKGLSTASLLLKHGESEILPSMAHYCCELASGYLQFGDVVLARKYIKRAVYCDAQCVRASLLLGHLEHKIGRYKQAIKAMQRIEQQDPVFLVESMPVLADCYHKIGQSKALFKYLEVCLERHASTALILWLVDQLDHNLGDEQLDQLIKKFLDKKPSLKALGYMLQYQMSKCEQDGNHYWQTLREVIRNLVETYPEYYCNHCGFSSRSLYWRCPSCQHWGTVKPG